MKEHKITQKELAASVHMSTSTLSRFLSKKTDKIKDEHITEISKHFHVSTDFLLGEVDEPGRKNYEIAELGLSAKAARNLYTGRVHPGVVNRLLESPRFAEVTYLIARYLDDTLAAGYAAQNQMYATLSTMLRGTVPTKTGTQAAREVARCAEPPYMADLTNIEEQFLLSFKEIKKEVGTNLTAVQTTSKEVVQKMFDDYSKGQEMTRPTITPEQLSDLITSQVSGLAGTDEEALHEFGLALTKFIQSTIDKAAQKGDLAARDLLLENNLGFIRKTANDLYFGMKLGENDLGIEREDLEQEGCLGLLSAIPHFQKNSGMKFLTYAGAAIRNAMTDLVRSSYAQYELRMTDKKDGLALQKIRLDEALPGEERMLRIEAIADPEGKTPEQVYEEKETIWELYAGLENIGEREQTYLLYRYGFADDEEHSLIGTAIHFHLSENRAKKLHEQAMDDLRLELPWWY